MYNSINYPAGTWSRGPAVIFGKLIENVLKDNNGIRLHGNDHFIGKDEKRRNGEVLHINFPYNVGNYCLFYKGTQEILKNACSAIEFVLNNENASEKEKSKYYKIIVQSLHVVHHKNTKKRRSKLAGINSMSTSCCDNSYCLQRMHDGDSICSHCYSDTQQKTQLALQDRNTINGVILRNIIIPSKYFKKYMDKKDISRFFRIESFGDVANKTQAINYLNLCKAFKRVHFAAWTKNNGIYHFAFMQEGKPDNLSFVVSSNKVNKADNYHMVNFPDEIDHTFTVYDRDYIEKNNICINCGGRSCFADCIAKHKGCYFKDTDKNISEELK